MDYFSLVSEVFDNCLGVKPGDSVWISSWDHTLDLAAIMQTLREGYRLCFPVEAMW